MTVYKKEKEFVLDKKSRKREWNLDLFVNKVKTKHFICSEGANCTVEVDFNEQDYAIECDQKNVLSGSVLGSECVPICKKRIELLLRSPDEILCDGSGVAMNILKENDESPIN